MWYSKRARLLSAMVPPPLVSLSLLLAMSARLPGACPAPAWPHIGAAPGCFLEEVTVIEIRRSALVPYTPAQMFDLVNDVEAYPKRIAWCSGSQVFERGENMLVARLDLKMAGFNQSFTTRNTLDRPHQLRMSLVDGPFRSLEGLWS